MEAVKRVEIVIDSLEANNVLQMLERIGVSGYTVLREATGKGGRGLKSADELTDIFKNSYILTACTADQSVAIVEALRPILKRFGGICLVSDAYSVRH